MPAELPKNRLPLHVEISEMLAREIAAGILVDGSRLAPERQMAEELGVAVGTLRKALLDLTQKGLLKRVHGSGNYVQRAKSAQTPQTIYSFFRLELLQGGGLPTAIIISLDRIKKTKASPDLGPSDHAFRIRRLRRLNNIDAALEEIWIDAPLNRNITKETISDSLYLFYKEQLGFWISSVEDAVSTQMPPDWTPKDFQDFASGNNEIWGYVERHGYNQDNGLAEFSRTWFNPKTTRYVARIK